MRSLLLYLMLATSTVSAQLTTDELQPLGNVTCTDTEQMILANEGTEMAIKVTSMAPLCMLHVNSSAEDEKGELTLSSLDGSCSIWNERVPASPPITATLPVTVWARVHSFSCVCPTGATSEVVVYEHVSPQAIPQR